MDDATIAEAVYRALRKAHTQLPVDVVNRLTEYRRGRGQDATIINAILENIQKAADDKTPMCQDTGVPVVYLTVGGDAPVLFNSLKDAVTQGVRRATEEIPLRANFVHPLTRENRFPDDLTPFIHVEFAPHRDDVKVTVLPKGGGSENMSRLAMLTPAQGIAGVKEFVLETIVCAGGNPCPPTIAGVGVGSTADAAMALAKKALLRPLDHPPPDAAIADLEQELLEAANELGVGPMGLGGTPTCLRVAIEWAWCNTNGLPVAVNLQCWANRHATVTIKSDGGLREHG